MKERDKCGSHSLVVAILKKVISIPSSSIPNVNSSLSIFIFKLTKSSMFSGLFTGVLVEIETRLLLSFGSRASCFFRLSLTHTLFCSFLLFYSLPFSNLGSQKSKTKLCILSFSRFSLGSLRQGPLLPCYFLYITDSFSFSFFNTSPSLLWSFECFALLLLSWSVLSESRASPFLM